jgi:diketogulonate reductase-like aldo/keto reductase
VPLALLLLIKSIVTESWSPLSRAGEVLNDQKLGRIADKYGKTISQVILGKRVDDAHVVFIKGEIKNRDVFKLALGRC